MINLNFEVNQQSLQLMNDESLANHSRNIIRANFTFKGEIWENIDKFAIFKDSWGNKTRVYLEDNSCLIPSTVTGGTFFRVSLYAGDLITTNYVTIPLTSTISPGCGCDPNSEYTNLFNTIFQELRTKYDDLILEDNKLYCYNNGDIIKILSFDELILNNHYTKEYIDSELSKKYDDFSFENGYLICSSNGEIRKRVPIIAVENYYTKDEIDERFDEINKKIIVEGEIDSTIDGVYLIFN